MSFTINWELLGDRERQVWRRLQESRKELQPGTSHIHEQTWPLRLSEQIKICKDMDQMASWSFDASDMSFNGPDDTHVDFANWSQHIHGGHVPSTRVHEQLRKDKRSSNEILGRTIDSSSAKYLASDGTVSGGSSPRSEK